MLPRYLLGPLPIDQSSLPALPAQAPCVTFGAAGAAVALSAADFWTTLGRSLPTAWQPEAILVALGATDVPVGLWSAPLPLVALAWQGPAHWHRDRQLLPCCDLVVCDRPTAERLRRLGYGHVHVPSRWSESLPSADAAAVTRDIDVLFVGDLHAARQRARLPWLARLAQLGRRWRVHVRTAVPPPEEATLQRARLLFHDGREAARQRLEQAAALGVVPLVPHDDAVAACWRHGHNCLRYTADNLETLVEHYLAHEEQRQQLAHAAQSTVHAADLPGFWSELFAVLQRDRNLLAERAARRVGDASPHEPARAWQSVATVAATEAMRDADLIPAGQPTGDSSAALLTHALLTAAGGEHAEAAEHLRRLLEKQPEHLLAGLYRAEALLQSGRSGEAVAQARQTLARLDGGGRGDVAALDAPPYPPGRDVFGVEWEQAAWQHAGDAAGECQAKQALLRWRLHGLLARQTGELVHRYEAALARPDLPATRATLGSALRQASRLVEATHQLRQSLAANPFDAAAARLLYDTLQQLGRTAEQQRLVEERRLLHQAAPQVVTAESWFGPPSVTPVSDRRPHVSLCMIVKDEEDNLPRCLTSIVDLVEEIIVVDTGSRDATKDVARRFGAQVYDFAWCESFAAARNESLRHARGNWVLWLDADDTLDDDNRQRLRSLVAALGHDLAAYLMRQHSLPDAISGTALVVDQAKLFRNDPRLRFEYRVHEQILPALLRLGGVVRPTDIVFHHSGYQNPKLRRRKLERNRRLLLLDQAERPDDPLTLFNLGTLHLDLGRPAEAVTFLQRGLERAPTGYSLVPRLHGLLTCGLHRLGRKQDALAACRRGRLAHPDEGDLLFWEAQLLRETGDEAGAEACWRRLLSLPPGAALACLDPGIHGYKSRHQLAQLCQRQGRVAEAEVLWREAVAERPDFVPAWLGLTELSLREGRANELTAEAARLASAASTREAASVVRARLHLARGERTAARALLEEAVRASPPALWSRLILGQVLAQTEGERAAAVRVLREVLALDPHQPEARQWLARLESSGASDD